MSAVAARSLFRSAARSATARLSAKAAPSPFRLHSRKSLSARVFRSPVEMSCVSVVSMLPYHTATTSALLTSMLSAAQPWSILGSGYISACFAAMVGAKGRAVCVEHILELTNFTKRNINKSAAKEGFLSMRVGG